MDQLSFVYILGAIAFAYVVWSFFTYTKSGDNSNFREEAFDDNVKAGHRDPYKTVYKEEKKKNKQLTLPTYILSGNKPHEILGVDPDASELQIKNAYKYLMKMCHPDRFQGEHEKVIALESTKKINKAKEEMLKLCRGKK